MIDVNSGVKPVSSEGEKTKYAISGTAQEGSGNSVPSAHVGVADMTLHFVRVTFFLCPFHNSSPFVATSFLSFLINSQ